jgi:hypothetical protein
MTINMIAGEPPEKAIRSALSELFRAMSRAVEKDAILENEFFPLFFPLRMSLDSVNYKWDFELVLTLENAAEITKESKTEQLEAEIVAWEARAAEFVDQGELIERLKAECAGLELMLSEGAEFDPCDDCEYKKEIERQKAVLLTIRDEVIGESAGKTWACRYVEEINNLLGERMKKERSDDQAQPQSQA